MEDKEIASSSYCCWRCKLDEDNREELVCLCRCADKLIHVYCLTKLVIAANIFYCPYCNARYPLERRPKSLLKMLLKVSYDIFLILLMIFVNYIIGRIVSVALLYVLSPFITKIINQCIFLWDSYMMAPTIYEIIKGIYELYHQWYKSTYEWKLIRPSTVKNIEEYNIEE
ncbi:uncharacterized protein LOC112637723 [Camponotus floridanus]|uniref:uncharacterized protein LOC112637723 n=1 Tax=Camponotus floridanus TaxID=104421 RepID=UPI000DC6A7B3|nr:uncharacterized protein LOC112637723 [Camponotus floridanus]